MKDETNEIPIGLRTLAAELDALGGLSNGPAVDALPDLDGSDFRPLALIGRGGMGEVYEAIQLSLNRPVAVKLLPNAVVKDAESQARFLAEAQTVARLHHPYVIQTIAYGVAHGRPYFAMELMTTPPVCEHTFVDAEEIVRFGIGLAEALAYVHSCGVIHRDVKPSNVFLGTDGQVRLADFGLANVLAQGGDALPTKGKTINVARASSPLLGTRRYMAPEQISAGVTTPKSDQYSFGVTMLELAASFPELIRNRDFAAILNKATTEDPEARYADMTNLAFDLGRFLRHEPVLARPAGAVRRFILWATRSPVAAGGVIVAVTLLIALFTSLAVGYIRTSRALAATEHEAENTARALIAALTAAPTDGDPAGGGFAAKRLNKLKTALKTVEELSHRYPENKEFPAAAERLGKAIRFTELHARRESRR